MEKAVGTAESIARPAPCSVVATKVSLGLAKSSSPASFMMRQTLHPASCTTDLELAESCTSGQWDAVVTNTSSN